MVLFYLVFVVSESLMLFFYLSNLYICLKLDWKVRVFLVRIKWFLILFYKYFENVSYFFLVEWLMYYEILWYLNYWMLERFKFKLICIYFMV